MDKRDPYAPSAPPAARTVAFAAADDDDAPLIAHSTPSYSTVVRTDDRAIGAPSVAAVEPPSAAPPPSYTADGRLVDAYGYVAPEPTPGRWAWLRRGALAVGRAVARGTHWMFGTRTHIRARRDNGHSLRQLVERYPLRRVAAALGLGLDDLLAVTPERRLAARWYPLSARNEPFVLRTDDWLYLRSLGLRAEHLRAFFNGRQPTLDDLLAAGLRPDFLSSIGANFDWLHANGALSLSILDAIARHSRREVGGAAAHYAPLLAADWRALGADGASFQRLGLRTEADWQRYLHIHPQWFGVDPDHRARSDSL